ncbi:MAG: alternative ribosome rescue aminoacyl-tRNA hydrolase ArfB [Candidatus Rifleibacteriota bacterium]
MSFPLKINDKITIPAGQIKTRAVRSSGPGGQNVNKVATCIELRFNPQTCEELKPAVTRRLLEAARNKLDSEGNILITCQQYREQYRNLMAACEKLRRMIVKALKPPKKRKPTRPSKAAKEKRIQNKKKNAEKKAKRKKPINYE